MSHLQKVGATCVALILMLIVLRLLTWFVEPLLPLLLVAWVLVAILKRTASRQRYY